MYLILVNILITTCMIVVIVECNHALIGNYSELIDQRFCGIGRNYTYYSDHNCFKWRWNRIPELKNARNVTAGEAPWTVLILTFNGARVESCTGSIIGKRWILTAGHCLENGTHSFIYSGYNFMELNLTQKYYYIGKNYYFHPNYSPSGSNNFHLWDDIGLVRTEKDMPIMWSDGQIIQNSICLPENNIKNEGKESALISGWGQNFRWGLPLQIALRQFNSYQKFPGDQRLKHWRFGLFAPKICMGDSGAPLWQYSMGRAVQIGINTLAYANGRDRCVQTILDESIAERVSTHMDWILEIIRNNTI